ncbi:hypothetical protein V1478_001628 [Vespula squamosa]|uniref:Uncharacterized protein n=1 Tax=Vespula squamosa TaxID=30214 RepID=A0ABD2C200_VESSQ
MNILLSGNFVWCTIKYEKSKVAFSVYFTFLLLKSKQKIIRCVWRRCIDRIPIPKLICKILFRQF